MATLISRATGNFTASTTWGTADSTAESDSEANSTSSTTSFVTSSAFTPGAITIDALLVKLASRTASPSGTFTIELFNSTDSATVSNTTTTVNVTDLPAGGGWAIFPTTGNVTLTAGKAYKIQIKSSVTSEVTLYRDATAGNWSRNLRTTTQASPASSDKLIMSGEYVSASSSNSFTITMNNTATTSFGPTVSGGPPQGVNVCKNATFSCGVAAATNYYFKWKGKLQVWDGGTFNIGSNGSQIPSDSTAIYEMDSVTNVDTGIELAAGSICNFYGNTFTNFKTYLTTDKGGWGRFTSSTSNPLFTAITGQSQSFLNLTGQVKINSTNYNISGVLDQYRLNISGVSPGSTTIVSWIETGSALPGTSSMITVPSTNGWASGDGIVVASTDATAQNEYRNIFSVDNSTGITLHSGLVFPHLASFPKLAEVAHISRNVKIRGVSTSLQGYINIAATATVTWRYAEFYQLGSGTASKRGINIATTTGTFDIQYCALHDFIVTSSLALNVTSASGSNITISNNAFWNINSSHITNAATTGTHLIDNNICIGSTLAVGIVVLSDVGVTFTNNVLCGGADKGLVLQETVGILGNISGNVIHSCSQNPLQVTTVGGGTITDTRIYKSVAVTCQGSHDVTFNRLDLFALTSRAFLAGSNWSNFVFNGFSGNADILTSQAQIWELGGNGPIATYNNSDFNLVTGMRTQTTNDFTFTSNNGFCKIICNNCTFNGSSNFISNQNQMASGSYIVSQKHNRNARDHRMYKRDGSVLTDTGIYLSPPLSLRLIPNGNGKIDTLGPRGGWMIALNSGQISNASVYVRKSVVGDVGGALYNGNQPRLMSKAYPGLGVFSESVIATATNNSSGAWELISGPLPTLNDDGFLELYVDCDGSAGWVNVDSILFNRANNTKSLQYWLDAGSFVCSDNVSNQSSTYFS